MSDFDPYLKWLGIRDPERPPNHYRLLGLDPYESDAEVISMAADRQMAHIRTFQIGKNGEVSQRIMNELAEARRCLLDHEKRLAYNLTLKNDAADPIQLAGERSRQPEVVQPVVTPSTEEIPTARVFETPEVQIRPKHGSEQATPTFVQPSMARKKSNAGVGLLFQLFAIVGGGLAAVGVAYALITAGFIESPFESVTPEPVAKLKKDEQPGREPVEPKNLNREKPTNRETAPPNNNPKDRERNEPSPDADRPPKNPFPNNPIPKNPFPTKPRVTGNNRVPKTSIPPWDEARWPNIPNEIKNPVSDLNRLLQKTRVHVALREFDKARDEWFLIKDQASAINRRTNFDRIISDLSNFWFRVSQTAQTLRARDQLDFRGTTVEVTRFDGSEVELKTLSDPQSLKSFKVDLKSLDRDLALAIVQKYELYDRPRTLKYLSFDFAHENNKLIALLESKPFAGMESDANLATETPDLEPARPLNVIAKKAEPNMADVVKARREIRDEFAMAYDSKQPVILRVEQAESMIDIARLAQDPVREYSLYRESINVAVYNGDLRVGLLALDQLDKVFEIEFWEIAVDLVSDGSSKVSSAKQVEFGFEIGRELAARALEQRKYEAASKIASKAYKLAEKINDEAVVQNAKLLHNETKEVLKFYERATRSRKQLALDPNNYRANEDLGTFLCLIENDFESGLKHWLKTNKQKYRSVAEMEFAHANGEQSLDHVLKLGEAWFRLGETKKTYRDARCLARSRHWFEIALPQLTGRYLTTITSRVNEINQLTDSIPSMVAKNSLVGVRATFWLSTWDFGSFKAKFSDRGTVRISENRTNKVFNWTQVGNEFHVVNKVDFTTLVFRPRPTGTTTAFEKVITANGNVILNGIGFPEN